VALARSVDRVLEGGGKMIGAFLRFGDKLAKYSQPRFFSNESLGADESRPWGGGRTAGLRLGGPKTCSCRQWILFPRRTV